MANIREKAISILAGNLNSGLSYLITTVAVSQVIQYFWLKLNILHTGATDELL